MTNGWAGSGSFPVNGRLMLPWPFAVLDFDEVGVQIRFRGWRSDRRNDALPFDPTLRSRWADLTKVILGPRSVVLFDSEGRARRFVRYRQGYRRELLACLQSANVPVTHRLFTARYWFMG